MLARNKTCDSPGYISDALLTTTQKDPSLARKGRKNGASRGIALKSHRTGDCLVFAQLVQTAVCGEAYRRELVLLRLQARDRGAQLAGTQLSLLWAHAS